jgi:hypothetical protein
VLVETYSEHYKHYGSTFENHLTTTKEKLTSTNPSDGLADVIVAALSTEVFVSSVLGSGVLGGEGGGLHGGDGTRASLLIDLVSVAGFVSINVNGLVHVSVAGGRRTGGTGYLVEVGTLLSVGADVKVMDYFVLGLDAGTVEVGVGNVVVGVESRVTVTDGGVVDCGGSEDEEGTGKLHCSVEVGE